jgi:hypothetical protein
MPTVGFETTIAAGERLKTYALDRAATGTGVEVIDRNLSCQIEAVIVLKKTLALLLTFCAVSITEKERCKVSTAETERGRIFQLLGLSL